jgi:hypothetical protein
MFKSYRVSMAAGASPLKKNSSCHHQTGQEEKCVALLRKVRIRSAALAVSAAAN